MSLDLRVPLEDIRDACDKIAKYASGLTFEDFARHGMAFDALVRQIAVIGEAATRLPPEFRQQYPGIRWRSVIGLRNIVIHNYAGIDDTILWEVVSDRVSQLRAQVDAILAEDLGESPQA